VKGRAMGRRKAFVFRVKIGRKTHYVELEGDTPGDRSVWTLQMRLRALGLFDAHDPDGRPTDATREAVRRFQRMAGLRVSGDVHDARMRLELRDAVRGAAKAGRIPETP
jgi:peptidoglycan hydrolase-like protein with peptidoglycan-binding domain